MKSHASFWLHCTGGRSRPIDDGKQKSPPIISCVYKLELTFGYTLVLLYPKLSKGYSLSVKMELH